MNVRPADSTAHAAATDIFAVTSACQQMGPIPFERLLRNNPSAAQPAPPSRTDEASTLNSARQTDRSHSVSESSQRATEDDEQDLNQASSDSETDEANEANASDESGADERSSEADEVNSTNDVATDSLIVAATLPASPNVVTAEIKVPDEMDVTNEIVGPDGGTAPDIATLRGELADGNSLAEATTESALAVPPADDTGSSAGVNTQLGDETVTGEVKLDTEVEGSAHGIGALPSALLVEPTQNGANLSTANGRRGSSRQGRDLASQRDDGTADAGDSSEPGANRRHGSRDNAGALADLLPVISIHDQALQLAGSESTQPPTTTAHGPEPAADLTSSLSSRSELAASRIGDSSPTANPLTTTGLTSRLPGHALVRGHGGQSSEPGGVHVDAARFLQRVARAFEAARDQGGEIRIRLSPPELGSLRVEVTMQDQGLAARVEAETPEARTILLENLPALRERLAEQGIKLERFDVDLPRHQSGQDRGQQSDQAPSRQPPPPSRAARAATEADVNGAATRVPTLAQAIHDRRLNVIV